MIATSLFIAAFEMLKNRVIVMPKTFFSNGFDQNGWIVDEQYKRDVLSKSKSPLYASLLWLQEMGAIDDSDIESFDGIRKHRNEVTHELLDFVSNARRNLDIEKFRDLIALLGKIEQWWSVHIEMAIGSDMASDAVDSSKIIPGSILSLQLMLDIALGKEPEEGYYYNEFMNRRRQT